MADGKADPKDPEKADLASVLSGVDPEQAARAQKLLAALGKKEKKSDKPKGFWDILRTLLDDREVGPQARGYRAWYISQEARVIEILDKMHLRLTDPELVRNWVLMEDKKRIERASLAFEGPVDREGTSLMRSLGGTLEDAENGLRGLGARIQAARARRRP